MAFDDEADYTVVFIFPGYGPERENAEAIVESALEWLNNNKEEPGFRFAPSVSAHLQIVSDVVHLLAAGAWLGALPGLVFLLGGAQPLEATAQMVRRFSTLGVLSVSALVLSGLGNSWYLVGTVPALVGTDYGQVLLMKLALFAAMVALAAVNRLSLTARLKVQDPSNPEALRSLRRNASLEIAAG